MYNCMDTQFRFSRFVISFSQRACSLIESARAGKGRVGEKWYRIEFQGMLQWLFQIERASKQCPHACRGTGRHVDRFRESVRLHI